MSDHANLPSTGTVENGPDTDAEYFSMMTAKPKAAKSRDITESVLKEIEQVLAPPNYDGLDFEVARRLDSTSTRECPFCQYSHQLWHQMQDHIRQHAEIAEFKSSVGRQARRLEGLHERRRQVEDSLQRLKVEGKQVGAEIHAFDRAGLAERERQLSRLNALLY